MALKNLLVKVGVSTKGLNADLRRTKNNFRRNFGEIQSLVNSTGRAMTASITAPLGLMAVQSVQAFNTQAKAIAQVEAGLRSTGEQVGYTSQQLQRMASDLQTKTLFGDEEILSGATAQLLTFTNISGDQFARTQVAALDLATRLDGDLKSASIQLGKALNDPIANLSALSRSGIQFSAEQKEVIKSLTETGRLAEAQTIILDELEKQYGGSAEAAAKAGTGGLKQLQNSIGDLQEQFGALIVEVMTPMVKHVQRVVAAFQTLSTDTKKNILIVAGLLGAAGPIALAVGALMPIFAALTGPIGLVAAAVGALSYLIIDNFSVIEPAIVAVVNTIITFQNKTKALGVVFELVKGVIMGVVTTIQTAFLNTIDLITGLGNAAMAVMEGDFSKAGDIMSGAFESMGQRTADAALDIGQGFMDGINDALNAEDIDLLEPDSISRFARKLKSDISGALSSGTTGPVDVPVEPRMQGMAARGVPGAGGDDEAAQRQERMVEMTNKQATAIENVGAAATATLQPMTDWTQVVADQQNLETGQRFNEMLYNMQDAALQLAQTIGTQLGGAFADMITGAKKSGEAFKGFAKEAIKAALAASQAHIIEAAISSGKMSGPLAMFVIPGLIAAGMGIVDAAFGDVAAFAAGGLVTGPVLGLVGEGPGTSRMNPEVIAPLDKLRDMMGGSQVQVTGMLRGADILLTNERAQIDRNRLRSF